MFPRRALRVLLTAACVLVTTRTVRAQAAAAAPHDYGTTVAAPVGVPGVAFAPLTSTTPFSTEGDVQTLRTAKGGNPFDTSSFSAPLRLPAGALIESLSMDACDDSGGIEPVSGFLVVADETGSVIKQTDTLTMSGTGCQSARRFDVSLYAVKCPP